MGIRRRYVRQSSPRPFDPDEPRYFVYRLVDGAGDVLYVGRSADPRTRLTQHRAVSEWAHGVRDMETWGPYTWPEACAQERVRIEAELPPYNRTFVS